MEGGETNEDWCGDVLINVGQEKDETGMKLLNRDTRQNGELYKQRKEGRKKEAYIFYRRKKRKDINKQIVEIPNQNSDQEYGKSYKDVKERKKHTYFIGGRRERRLINKLWTYKIRTIIKNTENSIKMLKKERKKERSVYIS